MQGEAIKQADVLDWCPLTMTQSDSTIKNFFLRLSWLKSENARLRVCGFPYQNLHRYLHKDYGLRGARGLRVSAQNADKSQMPPRVPARHVLAGVFGGLCGYLHQGGLAY